MSLSLTGEFLPSSHHTTHHNHHHHHPAINHNRSSSFTDFDFESEDFLSRWKRLSRDALIVICRKQHESLRVDDSAIDYVQFLCLKVLKMLTISRPCSLSDIERQIESSYHFRVTSNLLREVGKFSDLWAVKKTSTLSSRNVTKKASNTFIFSYPDFQTLLKEILSLKEVKLVDHSLTIAIIAIIEYVASEIFGLSGDFFLKLTQPKSLIMSKDDIRIPIQAKTNTDIHRLLFPEQHREGCEDCQDVSPSSITPNTQSSNPSFDHDQFDGPFANHHPLEFPSMSTTSDTLASISEGSVKKEVTYKSLVEDLIKEEQSFLLDVQLVIKVFREMFNEVLIRHSESNSANNSLPSSPTSPSSPTGGINQWSEPSSPTHKTVTPKITQEDIDVIFSNILDIEENTVNLLGSLEDALEAMSSDDVTSNAMNVSSESRNVKSGIESVGALFQDLTDAWEFDCFIHFANDVLSYSPKGLVSKSNEKLNQLLADPWIFSALSTSGQGFLPAVKYVLPKLLNGICYHPFDYLDYINRLRYLTPPSTEDRFAFNEAEHGLAGVIRSLKGKTGIDYHPPPHPNSGHPTSVDRLDFEKSLHFGHDFLRLSNFDKKIPKTSRSKLDEFMSTTSDLNKEVTSNMLDLLHEGRLTLHEVAQSMKFKSDPRSTSRHAFVWVNPVNPDSCPGVVILTKPSDKKVNFKRAKEQLLVKDLEVVDLPDFGQLPLIPEDDHHPTSHPSTYNSITSNVKGIRESVSQIKAISSSTWGASTTSLASSINSTAGLLGSSGHHHATMSSSTLAQSLRLTNAFEVATTETSLILSAGNPEDKATWMSLLVFLTTKSILDRRLKAFLAEESKRNPLQLPDPSKYRFSEPDTEQNIVFQNQKVVVIDADGLPVIPIIKAATLTKLIERLTYHQYADPKFVQMFLTTYRTFCSSQELLDLLIERFTIPSDHIDMNSREEVKRFEKDYVQPVQFRVLNVIRHWVDQYYDDFAEAPQLAQQLDDFLKVTSDKKKNARRFVESIFKTINKKRSSAGQAKAKGPSGKTQVFTFDPIPPTIEVHLERSTGIYNILTIHPVEFARQLTLYEFDLFRKVKPGELVGCAWTKENKEVTSPNLMNIQKFSTKLGYWLQKVIVETMNFDERVAVYSRIIEILQVLQELNNFNGVLEIVSVMNSSPVHRLEATKSKVAQRLREALEVASELNEGHHKKYKNMLKSINPPCVPFLGVYQTNIVYFEEGNQDDIIVPISSKGHLRSKATSASTTTISSTTTTGSGDSAGSHSSTSTLTEGNVDKDAITATGNVSSVKSAKKTVTLINFYKRRKVAEITADIQQYQNTPYCLTVNKEVRRVIEEIDPFADFPDHLPASLSFDRPKTNQELEDYLWEMSKVIEPKPKPGDVKRAPEKFDRRWPDLPLKSPGIKVTSQTGYGSNTLSRIMTPRAASMTASASLDQGQVSPSHAVLQHHRSSSSNPTTPSSPPTATSMMSASDHSVFAPVMIGGYHHQHRDPSTPPTPSGSLIGFPSTMTSSPNSAYQSASALPPPLPPRTGKFALMMASMKQSSMESDSPPPLPPRMSAKVEPRLRTHGHHLHTKGPDQGNLHPLHFGQASRGIAPPPIPPPTGHHVRQASTESRLPPPFKLQGVPHPVRRNSDMRDPAPPVAPLLPGPRRHSSTASTPNSATSPPPPYSSVVSTSSQNDLVTTTGSNGQSAKAIPELPPRTYKAIQTTKLTTLTSGHEAVPPTKTDKNEIN